MEYTTTTTTIFSSSQYWSFEELLEMEYHITNIVFIYCLQSVFQTLEITSPQPYKSFVFTSPKIKNSAQMDSFSHVISSLRKGNLVFFLPEKYLPSMKTILPGFLQILFTGLIALLRIDILPMSDINRCGAFRLYRK